MVSLFREKTLEEHKRASEQRKELATDLLLKHFNRLIPSPWLLLELVDTDVRLARCFQKARVAVAEVKV
jgi:hypothetical protein